MLNFFATQWINILTVTVALFTIIIVLKIVDVRTAKPTVSETFNTNCPLKPEGTSGTCSTYIMPDGKDTDANYYLNGKH